ncbi:MAG: nitrous oxide reductase family maturation protein NosD, partial [Anaerolineae bacterium]|nr:nitrous oxide reductase family maturation protein NosD [Anaerolineae bacterium]
MKQTSLILLLNFIVAACLAGSAASAQENGFDLQAAIDAAAPGAVIDVPPGVYRQNLVIAKPITLAGLDWPVIDGGNQGNVIEINQAPDVTIRGLVIRNSGSR